MTSEMPVLEQGSPGEFKKSDLGRQLSTGSVSTECSSDKISDRRSSAGSCLDSVSASFDTRSFVQYHATSNIEKRYVMDRKAIANGGYGKVFLAEDRHCPGRTVAIKQVLSLDTDTLEMYRREAQTMQELDHPGICRLFEVYEDQEDVFLVMEYLSGGEVFEKLLDTGHLSEEQTADIIRQVTSALKYAHACGVAHRDLKPENICFCSPDSSQVKVIDWGLSSFFHQRQMKSSVGSPTYAGPEVFSSQGKTFYTSTCDLWSLGVLTYVLLSGRPPFWGGYHSQLRAMKEERYPMQSGVWPQISENAKDFISRLLKADPESRMTTEDALKHPFLTNRPVSTTNLDLKEVLENMVSFSATPRFFSLVIASAARQLNHTNVHRLSRVFSDLDTNNDGVLDEQEVLNAFYSVFGTEHVDVEQVKQVFSRLDLNATGKITYTEFCAAAMGREMGTQDGVLWSAFTAFDIHGDGDRIVEEEIEKVLANANANATLSKAVCELVAHEIMEAYDSNNSGDISFTEFKQMMLSCVKEHETGQVLGLLQQLDRAFELRCSQPQSPTSSSEAEVELIDASTSSPPMSPSKAAPRPKFKKTHTAWAQRFVTLLCSMKPPTLRDLSRARIWPATCE